MELAPKLAPCLCPKEVATVLGVSERTALRLMVNGDILSFRAGRKPWRTTVEHLRAYIESRTRRRRIQNAA